MARASAPSSRGVQGFEIRHSTSGDRRSNSVAVLKLLEDYGYPGDHARRERAKMSRFWRVLAIIVLGAALALAILNGWYHG
jgi:hypothetical protein